MSTIQKPKGVSLDRLLNDPMAMFGALGVCGALVVVVWVVAGSSAPKDDDANAGSFADAPSAAVSAKAAAPAGSNLGVAKFKAGTRGAALPDRLKDAGGSSSLGGDGVLRGTMAEIAAGQKEEPADAATAGAKKPIPVESGAGAHVPGAVPDSTQLAAAGKAGFGPAPNLNNSDYSAAGSGASGPIGAAGSSAAGAAASAPPAEGGPLASAAVPGRSAAVVGGHPFMRSQSAGGTGPAGVVTAPRRAAGGLGAGGAGPAPTLSGVGPDFSDVSVSVTGGGSGGASRGGSAAASAYGEAGERMASVGGGAPKAGGLGGLGAGRGPMASSESGSDAGGAAPMAARSASTVSARKSDLKDQAKKHLEQANTYRESVVMPLAKRERAHAVLLSAKLGAASAILTSLDKQLGVEQAFFRNAPAAAKALANSRALIGQGPDSLKARVASSQTDMLAGSNLILSVPQGCNFKPTVKETVFQPWNPAKEGYNGRGLVAAGGRRGLVVVGGQRGRYVEVERVVDLHGVATRGQDLLEGATRRASNVRTQSEAGVTMVDPEFDPAIEALSADPAAAQRLTSVAGRIKDDLGRVAALLPERVTDAAGESAANQGALQQAALEGYSKIGILADTVGQKRLSYPDGPDRDALDRNMVDARRNSTEALSSVNSLQGTSSDTMFVLTGASRSSTYALVDLCYSRDHLNAMVPRAKD